MSEDASRFDHCKLTNAKLYLNTECYPYDDLNLDFDKTDVRFYTTFTRVSARATMDTSISSRVSPLQLFYVMARS